MRRLRSPPARTPLATVGHEESFTGVTKVALERSPAQTKNPAEAASKRSVADYCLCPRAAARLARPRVPASGTEVVSAIEKI
jgi:hypothetical protein